MFTFSFIVLFVDLMTWGTFVMGDNDGLNEGYFWQITDIHYDANYSETGLAKYLCHQDPWDTDNGNNTQSEHHGKYGDAFCDSPWALVNSSVQAMRALAPDVDFILWTGDNLPHVPENVFDSGKAFAGIKIVTDLLQQHFPATSIYPTIGNHDRWPANLVPPTDKDQYYSRLADEAAWRNLLDEQSLETFKRAGYYSTQNSGGLQVIGLNTMLWFERNTLIYNLTDPGGQFAWLERELETLRDRKAKVLLFAHVPPGYNLKGTKPFYVPVHNPRFLKLLHRYADMIMALTFGHEHIDRFHVIYNEKGDPVYPVFVAPSVTPLTDPPDYKNPAIRLYKYSRKTGHVLDYTQYYLNLTMANLLSLANWNAEYTPTEAYGIDSLRAKSLDKLLHSFKSDKSENFQKYWLYRSVSVDQTTNCSGACKHRALCAISCLDLDMYDQCMKKEEFSVVYVLTTTTKMRGSTSPVVNALIATFVTAVVFGVIVLISLLYNRQRMEPKYTLLPTGETIEL